MIITLRRGDANKNGSVSITNALFIAQYLAGTRDISTLNTVNAASPKLENPLVFSGLDMPISSVRGEKINVTDALFIAQMLAGKLTLNSYQGNEHPISDMIIANINFNAVGASGSSTNLIITIKSLETNAPHPVEISPRVTHNGKITIQ